MSVPLQWLLARRELGLVLLTSTVPTGREIDIVVTTELADPSRWLSGGELVLTTGLVPAGEDADAYVQRLAGRGVVALGFGVGVSVDEVPAGLLAAAQAHDLPLLEVPLPTPFVAVARTVADRIGELAALATQAAARAQPRMTRAAVAGGSSAVLRELAAACGGVAVLTDRRGAVVKSAPAPVGPAIAAAVTAEVRRLRTGTASVSHSASGALVVQEVAATGDAHGYLAVLTDRRPLPADRVLIGHATSLLALAFERSRGASAADGRALNAAALGLLLTGEADRSAAGRLVAEAADDADRLRAMVLTAPSGTAAELAGAVEGHWAATGHPVFVWSSAGPDFAESVTLLPSGADAPGALLGALGAGLRRRVRASVSASCTVADLPAAVEHARRAARSARPGGPAADADALTGRSLLGEPAVRAAVAEIAQRVVTPLRDYDTEHGTHLLVSLRAYLECHGHWEAAGAVLGVHRHTLRSRIARVQEVARVDLASATVRAELLLALLV